MPKDRRNAAADLLRIGSVTPHSTASHNLINHRIVSSKQIVKGNWK